MNRLTIAFAGIVVSLALGFGGMYFLAGAGHGWCSSVWSFLAILFVPILCVGLVSRDPKQLRSIAWYVASACVFVDGVMAISTSCEGWSAMVRVWNAVPAYLVGWLSVWLLIHIFVVLLWRKCTSVLKPV
ncbi:MAG TPA: hypothetical protein VK327_07720 [Candidatus Paceibacterota bacterium]|nr:hypothetical protein [Candidatus Paceibacterota bacterium]